MPPATSEPTNERKVPDPSTAPKKLGTALFNFWLDVVMGCAAAFLMWASTMLQVVFPPPTFADGWTLWGWSYNQWRNAQFVSLCLVMLLVVEHVVLHWNWVCGVIATKILRLKKRPDDAIQKIYGIGFFFALMLVAFGGIVAAALSVAPPTVGLPLR